jgi:synaptic vesicle membrane protein VAT-1
VVVHESHFSVNYADVCIRWGLYESALRYVGWPIVPGFDFSGTVLWAGTTSGFTAGDEVFGFSLFGTYSSKLLVPGSQLRSIPAISRTAIKVSHPEIAAIPATAATALHSLALAGAWPQKLVTKNKAALIHSAAGGVGSILQMCKAAGFYPVVAVVGSSHKVSYCSSLGADFVIDKSTSRNLWAEARSISPDGYSAIFDANGVETIEDSYEHLTRCGKLIIYGFHSNESHSRHAACDIANVPSDVLRGLSACDQSGPHGRAVC